MKRWRGRSTRGNIEEYIYNGNCGDGSLSDIIRDGTLPTNSQNNNVSTQWAPIPELYSKITLQQSKDVFTSTWKYKASSPSGIYHGYYKASCESDTLAKLHLLFMTVRFQVSMSTPHLVDS